MATSVEVPLLSSSLSSSWLSWQSPDPLSTCPLTKNCWLRSLVLQRSGCLLPPPALQPTNRKSGASTSYSSVARSSCTPNPSTTQRLPGILQHRALRVRCVSASCSRHVEEAVEGGSPNAASNGSDEDGWAEKRPQPELVPRPWPRPAAAELVSSYRYEVAHEGGHLVIQPLEVQYYEATVDLLAVCFADSIDAASLLGYIRTQIVKYLQEQERFFAKGQGVCLVALWSPPVSAPDALPPSPPMVVGTVSLAFAVRSLPRFPTLNVPGDRSNAYLSNMAVQPSHRRRGVARELLTASEELSAALGKRALYLHVRFVDKIPQRVYSSAGYSMVARDTILSWLFLQRRRSLMRKQLPRRPHVDTALGYNTSQALEPRVEAGVGTGSSSLAEVRPAGH